MAKKLRLNRIKAVIAEKGITTIELAQAVGKGRSTVSRWCTNDIQPPLETLYKVADFLEISAKDLIYDKPVEM